MTPIARPSKKEVSGGRGMGAHNVLVPAVLQALQARGLGDVPVFVGGIIPEEDAAALRAQGVSAVFGPGTSTSEIIRVMQSVAAARPSGS